MPAGNTADISLAIQAAKGTASVVGSQRSYLAGGGFGPIREVADLEETSSGRLRNAAYISGYRAEGSPEFIVRPKFIGLLLYGVMGGKAVSGAGDPWTHTFTLAATQPYLTLWRTLATLFERFADCKVAELNFQSQSNGPLRVTAHLIGLGGVFKSAAEVTVAVETSDAMMHADGKSQYLVETIGVSATRRVSVNIAAGVQVAPGDSTPGDSVEEGQQVITIEMEQTVSDFALWNRFHYGVASPADNAIPINDPIELAGSGVDIKWSRRTAAGVDATPARSLQITATRLQIQSIAGLDPNTSGDPLVRTVTYKVYQPASGSGLTAVLKNGQSSYAAS